MIFAFFIALWVHLRQVAIIVELGVSVVAGAKDDFETLIVTIVFVAIYLDRIVVIPVDAVEAACWVFSNLLQWLRRSFLNRVKVVVIFVSAQVIV